MRKWVVNNIDKEPALFRGIYDVLYEALDSKSVPHAKIQFHFDYRWLSVQGLIYMLQTKR